MLSRIPRLAGVLAVMLVVSGGVAFAWLSLYRPCTIDAVQESASFLDIQLKQYDDVFISASSGTPDSLTYPISVLQQILVDTQQVEIPGCMGDTRDEAISYMETVIQALRAYAAGEENTTVEQYMNDAYLHFSRYRSELNRVRRCAPLCFPLPSGR